MESVLFNISLLKETIVHVIQACLRRRSVVGRHELLCSCFSMENAYLGILVSSYSCPSRDSPSDNEAFV